MTQKSRRRFVQLAGSALAVGLAGCSSQDGESGDSETTTATEETTTATTTGDQTTEAETTTATTTEGDHEHTNDSDHPEDHETPADGEEIHRHGTLYLEIDGERVDFSRGKFLDGPLEFHFHDDGKQYEWHNERETITLAEALNFIPDISYENSGSDHTLTVEGTTYDTAGDAEISFAQRDVEIDPTTYTLKDLDIIWVRVSSDGSETTTTSS